MTHADLMLQEDALSLTAPRQRRRRRRKIEIEAERAAKRRNLMEMVAQLRESHAATESQSQAIDLTKVRTLTPCPLSVSPNPKRSVETEAAPSVIQGVHHHHKASTSLAGFPSALVTSPSLKAQMELLQQAPPSAHRANGSLEADLPIMRRRRGRRKNVEGLELLFMGNKRAGGVCVNCVFSAAPTLNTVRVSASNNFTSPSSVDFQDDAEETKVSAVEAVQGAARAHRPHTVPEQSPSARSLASGSLEDDEAAVSNKELGEWLRQHPTYTMDMAGFTPVRHRLTVFTYLQSLFFSL